MNGLMTRARATVTKVQAAPRQVKLFLLIVLLYGIAVEGISMVLLNLYLLRLGYGTEFIGAVNSAGLFVFAAVSLPIGAVQRYSSRQMMQLGQIVSIAGLVGLPLAQFAPTGEAGLLIAFRILEMIGLSCFFVHQLPFALEITRPSWHNRILSWTMAVFSLAAFLGSWLGGVLPAQFGRWFNLSIAAPAPFQLSLLSAAALLVPALLAIRLIPERMRAGGAADRDAAAGGAVAREAVAREAIDAIASADTPPASRPAARRGADWSGIVGLVAIIIFVRALQTGGIGVSMTFANVYFDEALRVPTGQIGLVSGLGRLLGVPMSLTLPWLINRYGNFRLVTISLALIVLLIVPMALIPVWPVAAAALIAINSMGSLRYLSFVGYTMSLVKENQRALITGAGEMAIGAGFALSSLIGGYLIAWSGYRAMFLFGGAMTTVGAIAFWLIFRRRPVPTPTPAPIPPGD